MPFSSSGCQVCDCNTGMNNTGIGCSTIMSDAIGLILVPTFANDGIRNGITVGTTLDQTFFDALINNTDLSKRWYPLDASDGIKNVEDMREDPVFNTATDGSKEKVRDGIASFKGELWGRTATPKYVGTIEAAICQQMSVYKIDRDKNLIGSVSSDGTVLYPIRMDSGSIYAMFKRATPDKNKAAIVFGFDFAMTEKDKSLEMIACSEIEIDISTLRGLLDVCPVLSEIETTGFTVRLNTEFGTITNPFTVQGLLVTNFEVINVTQSNTPIALTGTGASFTETSPGVYQLVFATADQPDNGDILKLIVTKNQYDFTCVSNEVIQVPIS